MKQIPSRYAVPIWSGLAVLACVLSFVSSWAGLVCVLLASVLALYQCVAGIKPEGRR